MLKKYNKFKKCYTELKEGEEFCKTCHGEGMVKPKRTYTEDIKKGGLLVCNNCLGHGKLDWVENVIGVKQEGLPNISLHYYLVLEQQIYKKQKL